jgi:hypothetical protein
MCTGEILVRILATRISMKEIFFAAVGMMMFQSQSQVIAASTFDRPPQWVKVADGFYIDVKHISRSEYALVFETLNETTPGHMDQSAIVINCSMRMFAVYIGPIRGEDVWSELKPIKKSGRFERGSIAERLYDHYCKL